MEKTFTIEEIEKAIRQSPKHIVEVKTPPNIDGMLGGQITTIEVDMFRFRLFGSNKGEYDKYKTQNSTEQALTISVVSESTVIKELHEALTNLLKAADDECWVNDETGEDWKEQSQARKALANVPEKYLR